MAVRGHRLSTAVLLSLDGGSTRRAKQFAVQVELNEEHAARARVSGSTPAVMRLRASARRVALAPAPARAEPAAPARPSAPAHAVAADRRLLVRWRVGADGQWIGRTPAELAAALDGSVVAHVRSGPRLGFLQGSILTSVDEIEAHARAAMARVGADRCLVVVDYLQRLAYRERFQDVRANVSALSFSLREMAVRLGSPVLALTSLSREVADMDLPTLEALKESGNLEYDADGVLLLGVRKEITLCSMARVKAIAGARLLDLLVAKNRYGEADCRIPFLFNPVVGNFEEELPT